MRAAFAALVILTVVAPTCAAPPAQAQVSAPVRGPALRAFDAKIEAAKQAMMGDPSAARRSAEGALRAAETMRSDRTVSPRDAEASLATARWLLGEALIGLNETPRAKAMINEALAAVQAHDRGSKLHGDLLRSRGAMAEMGGDVQTALRDYLAAYNIFRANGERRSQSIALQDIGNLYLTAGDFERVRSYYSQSLEAYSKDPWLNVATYNNRGQAYQEQHRFIDAEKEYELALTAVRQLRSPLLEARILTNLADSQAEGGKHVLALRTLDRAGALAQSGEGVGWRPFVYGVRARVEAKRGNDTEAARLFTLAFAGQDLAHSEMSFRELHRTAAQVFERLGQQELALAHFKAYQRLDSEALHLTASASAQLLAAQFDFANQNLRISQLKQGQLQRDITIERQRNQFRTNLFMGLGTALLTIFALLAYGYISLRRSRDRVRAANTELSASNIALEKALQARTDFLATTSHEIRTPLNGILGMAQVLLADRRIGSDVRERIQLLYAAGETMKTLVDDILDVAKMEAGEVTLDLKEVDLSRLLADCVGLWREAAANKSLELTCKLDAVPARVLTDGDRLRQIVSNLLSNAVKFTPVGSVTLAVRGLADNNGSVLEFEVRDTGIGISPNDQASVFEAFTQVNNSTTREYSGTGLGLAISQRLAGALGGQIVLKSEVGEGSCFKLRIPVQTVGTALASLAEDKASLRTADVLLVDRNLTTHALMRMLLAPETRSIHIAVSVEDALERMGSAHFDHVIVEGASVAAEGRTAIEGVRMVFAAAQAADARTSLLAAPSEKLTAAQIIGAGAGQVILKPIGAAELIIALKRAYDDPIASDLNAAEMRMAG